VASIVNDTTDYGWEESRTLWIKLSWTMKKALPTKYDTDDHGDQLFDMLLFLKNKIHK
jgi:hypothetical protein